MNLKKIGAVIGAAALLAVGAVVGIAAPASAHTPDVTASCSQLNVHLTSYATSKTKHNTVTITVNNKTVQSAEFQSSYDYSWSNPDTSKNYSYSVKVTAFDNSTYNFTKSGTTTSCVAPAQVTCTTANQHQNLSVYDALVDYVDRVTGKAGQLTVLGNKNFNWSNSKFYPLPQSYSITQVRFKTVAGNDVVWTGSVNCGLTPLTPPTITNGQPTCSLPGLAVVNGVENTTYPALNTQPGSYSETFAAASGYIFNDNGKAATTVTVPYQVLEKKSADLPECVREQYPYVTVVWQMPTKNTPSWPQSYVSSTPKTTTADALNVDVPKTCGTYYQVDAYYNNDTTADLIAGGKLNQPNNPSEALIPGGEGTAWKFVINPDCKSVTVPTVTYNDNTCGDGSPNASLTLPAIEGVIWHVNNPDAVTAPGTYPLNAGGPNVITATAASGYVLTAPFSQNITVGPVKTNQSTNPQGECYVPPTIQACANPADGILSTNLDANGWTFGDTRSAGHNKYVAGALHVYTDDSSSNAKAAGYHAVNFPLSEIGSPSIDMTDVTGVAPGLQLGIDRDGNGTWDGYLVNEGDTYGAGNWWTNKSGFGVPSGFGYPSVGTLQAYLAANPNAKVVSVGYSLGSGVKGSATIKSITVGCQTFTFDYKTQAGAVATATVAAQPTCHDGATESFAIDHAHWLGDAVQNKDGSWSRTAEADGDYAFADGKTTLTLSFDLAGKDDSLCAEATLTGSTATGQCLKDAPWIFYDVTLTNPDDVPLSDNTAHIEMSDGTHTTTVAIPGTFSNSGGELKGKVLWPGATVAADGETPTGWPGWTQNADGTWVTTTGNFAWTRSITSAKLIVNPEITVALSYPPATPSCNAAPPVGTDGKANASGDGLASTGSNVEFGLVAGAAILVLGGITLAFGLIRRRRTAGEQ